MRTSGFVGLLAVLATTGCYREYSQESTMPAYAPQPTTVSGPPGGEMDPGYGYEAPGQPGYPAGYPGGYPGGYPPGTEYGATAEAPAAEPSADPQAPGYVMGTVTDGEIDQALQGHGEWVVTEEYGRVWRPDTTVVGVNFTPYETCGSWVYTDHGWTFQSCDDWSWGWLAFHYGQWDWFDGGWCWVPDYTWGPGWVDWRTATVTSAGVSRRPRSRHRGGHRGKSSATTAASVRSFGSSPPA
jgi:hypothetical protein